MERSHGSKIKPMSTIASGKGANLIFEIGVLKLKMVATVSSLKL